MKVSQVVAAMALSTSVMAQGCATSTAEAQGIIGTLVECVDKCTRAVTTLNTCTSLKDCVCALVDDVNSDLSACLLCGTLYDAVDSIVDGLVGEFLLGCNYQQPPPPLCSAPPQSLSSTTSAASTSTSSSGSNSSGSTSSSGSSSGTSSSTGNGASSTGTSSSSGKSVSSTSSGNHGASSTGSGNGSAASTGSGNGGASSTGSGNGGASSTGSGSGPTVTHVVQTGTPSFPSSLPSCATSTPEAEKYIGSFEQCINTCGTAAKKLDTCNNDKDCICSAADHGAVEMCLTCSSFYSECHDFIEKTIGSIINECNVKYPKLELCGATACESCPSATTTVAIGHGGQPGTVVITSTATTTVAITGNGAGNGNGSGSGSGNGSGSGSGSGNGSGSGSGLGSGSGNGSGSGSGSGNSGSGSGSGSGNGSGSGSGSGEGSGNGSGAGNSASTGVAQVNGTAPSIGQPTNVEQTNSGSKVMAGTAAGVLAAVVALMI